MNALRTILPALFLGLGCIAAPETVFQDDFSKFADGLPAGWRKYETGKAGTITPEKLPGGKTAVRFAVTDPAQSLGLTRQFPAQGGKYYRATLDCSVPPGGSRKGAYLQIRFYPYSVKGFGNSAYLRQLPLADYDPDSIPTDVTLKAPEGTTHAACFIITAGGAPQLLLNSFELQQSDTPFAPRKLDPMKVPGILEIQPRDLCLETDLASAVIVAPAAPEYRELAERAARAVEAKTGTRPEIRPDDFACGDRLSRHLVTIGSRDVNRTVSNLYNRFYTFLDGKYPGKGGRVVRSLHNPFGDGHNVITVGGSDFDGDRAAVERFAELTAQTPSGKFGWLADLKLGDGLTPPADAKDAQVWDDYGWSLVSKNLSLFYMTDDPKYAKEFLRLAFPDEKAADELNRLDGEFTYANLKNPLGEPYHYNATMLIPHWDLVEESPVFSDADRLRVTRKFYEQLNRRRQNGDKGIYKLYERTDTPVQLPDRHWISEALTVYVAARYFDKYYPSRDGRDGLEAARRMFKTLDRYAAMTVGSLFWYNSFLRPAFDYAVLDGGLKYVGSPVIGRYVEALTLLADRTPHDWSQKFSGLRLLLLCGYLTQNQAPVELAELRTGFDTEVFRLGQSYWPAKKFERIYFSDTDGKWRAAGFDPAGMPEWDPPFDKSKVVEWMSFRRHGARGEDFALIDAKYESGRNAFHNFALVSLYLRGLPLLRGYHNQLHVYRDGLGDPAIAKFTEVLDSGRTGKTAFVRGRLAKFNGHDWERTLLIRENGFLIELDAVTPLADTAASQLIAHFETPRGTVMKPAPGAAEFQLQPPAGEAWTVACSLPAELSQTPIAGGANLDTAGVASRFTLIRPGKRAEAIRFASLLRPGAPEPGRPAAAQQGGRIALRLPHEALLELLPGSGFRLEEPQSRFGFRVTELPGVFTSTAPVTAECDLMTGTLALAAPAAATVTLSDGRTVRLAAGEETAVEVKAAPLPALTEQTAAIFAARREADAVGTVELPALKPVWELNPGVFISVHCKLELDGVPHLAVATGDRVLLIGYDGGIRQEFRCSATVGALCYWPEKQLLLAGSIDEKLRAFTLDGRQVWEFTSRMPDGVKHERMWWAKGEMPGVCAVTVAELLPGKPLIFVGGASTLEILDENGKLLKRRFQEWGTFEGFTPLPAHGKEPASLLSWGFMVGHPTVYCYTAGLQRGTLDLCFAKDGTFMGSFGFGFIGRNNLRVARLEPGQPERLVGDFNGSVNRVMVWDLNGRVLHEADLGFGIRAFGGIPYAKTMLRNTNVRGLELPDFDGDGVKSIAVAFQRRFVTAFDPQLRSRFFCPLPEEPLLLALVPGAKGDRLAVAGFNGGVYLIDGSGRLTARARVKGRPTLLASDGRILTVGTDAGVLRGFALPDSAAEK